MSPSPICVDHKLLKLHAVTDKRYCPQAGASYTAQEVIEEAGGDFYLNRIILVDRNSGSRTFMLDINSLCGHNLGSSCAILETRACMPTD